MASWTEEEGWRGKLKPYGPLELLPSAQVLNYGQSIFEGMKVGRQREHGFATSINFHCISFGFFRCMLQGV